MAATTHDTMRGRTATAVAAVRAPNGSDSLIVLLAIVILGLLTQAAWMHAT